MSEKIKEYESEELTVVWKAEKCIHSEICFKGLPDVFDPKARPWVNVKGENDQRIKEQIDKCPSGALSYKLKSETQSDDSIEEEQIVEVIKGGPLMVYGNIKVKHHDGSEASRHRVTAFCRCGASSNKPFCDGTHKKIEFEG